MPVVLRVLVVDDDPLFQEIVQFHLARAGYLVEGATDARTGLNRAMDSDFDLVILDLMMSGLSGEDVLRLLKPLSLQHRVIVVSAHSAEAHQARVRDLGAAAYLQKPVVPEDLLRLAEDLLQRPAGETHPEEPRHVLDRMALWIFDRGPVTPAKQAAALSLLLGFLGLLVWLFAG